MIPELKTADGQDDALFADDRAWRATPLRDVSPGLRSEIATVSDGVRIHYVTCGKGPLLVLLHGFPQYWREWLYIIPLLADAGYSIIAPDLRGFGRSDKPHDGYDVVTVAADCEQEDRPAGYLTCVALEGQARSVRSELLADLIVQWVIHRITAAGDDRPSVVIAGADELACRHLDRLCDACERRGVPLTVLFRRLEETSARMLGGGAVAFMRLGNHTDATTAADYIGRENKFVLSQITTNVGGSESDTNTDTDTHGAGDTSTFSLSRSIGTSTTRAAPAWVG